MPDALDAILPPSITNTAKRSGNEWVLPLPEAKQAIELASDNGIAILGVESLRIEDGGFGSRTTPDTDSNLRATGPIT
jgi:hypothetical protein